MDIWNWGGMHLKFSAAIIYAYYIDIVKCLWLNLLFQSKYVATKHLQSFQTMQRSQRVLENNVMPMQLQ